MSGELDAAFAVGPERFLEEGLPLYLADEAQADEDEEEGDDDEDDDSDDDDSEDDDSEDDDGDDEDAEGDNEAFSVLARAGDANDFAEIYGVELPEEAKRFFAAVAGHDRWRTFRELRLDNPIRPDVGEHNLFELMIRRNQAAYLGTDLVEAFCGVFGIGSQGNGDTYHLEIHPWDEQRPRQVLHYDHETHAFSGVFSDSLDSLVYLAALVKARDQRRVSEGAFAAGMSALRGKIAPTWQFSVEELDAELVAYEPERRDTEFFFYRSRWITALLKNDGITDIASIPELFNADFNQAVPVEQLSARYEACAKYIPTALYAMWRAYLFDEQELDRYLEIGRAHAARLVRDAAKLIDSLRGGRNQLGTITDVRGWLAAFRALDLDPRRAAERAEIAQAKAAEDAARADQVSAELSRTPEAHWPELAWQWLDDGVAHRELLRRIDRAEAGAGRAQIAELEELDEMTESERMSAVPRIARELSPALEAVLVGSLVRGDRLEGALAARDDDDEPPPEPSRVAAALAMTSRALKLAPEDSDVQFTHAMLLVEADRIGELTAVLPRFAPSVRLNIATRMGKTQHPQFAEVADLALAAPHGSYSDVPAELFGDLGEALVEQAPDKLVALAPLLPANVDLLAELAYKAIDAELGEAAMALYDRLLATPIPDEDGPRQSYLRAMNNACVEAHAQKAFVAAAKIADRAQPYAHENPHLYHASACAYAASGDYAKALEQVRLAMQHGYEHVERVESDDDLGPLLEWPEFKAMFRDWHAREEGN